MYQEINNQRGIALPIVLAILVIITLLGFTAMSLSENQTLMVNRHQQSEKALYYAEAGVHRYINLLNDDRDFYKNEANDNLFENIAFESGYYSLTIIRPTDDNPVITIQSKGWTAKNPQISRTIEVSIHKRGFAQNLFVTNSEKSGNDEIWWVRGDVVDGPLHTNGNISIDGTAGTGTVGPIFKGPVTYSGELTLKKGSEDFVMGNPEKVGPLIFPNHRTLHEKFEKIAEDDNSLYEGRTCIYLDGDNLKIRNKDKNIETREIPSNQVIYVKGGNGDKWANETANVFISGELEGRLTIVAENDIYLTTWDPTNWTAPKKSGKKHIPLGTPTKGITYKNYNINTNNIAEINDMLGLVAAKNVLILHYGWPKAGGVGHSSNYDVGPKNITIHAAILALGHSFGYERHNEGEKEGILTILGSITQIKRGPVGVFSSGKSTTGYSKNYSHDTRMLHDMPPHFLEPMNSGWEIREWKEI